MKRIALAALLAAGLATAGAAHAKAPDSAGRVPGGGAVVGGGVATLTGGGDDMRITYAGGGAGGGSGFEQAGRLATFAGSDGEGRPRWTYGTPAMGGGGGRVARVSGGGDDAQVTYDR